MDSFLKDSFRGFVSCKQKSQITRFVSIRKDSYTNPASLLKMHYVKKRRLICQIDFDCKKPNTYGLGQILSRGILGDVRKSNGGGGLSPFCVYCIFM